MTWLRRHFGVIFLFILGVIFDSFWESFWESFWRWDEVVPVSLVEVGLRCLTVPAVDNERGN